jgi:hypothetical protein
LPSAQSPETPSVRKVLSELIKPSPAPLVGDLFLEQQCVSEVLLPAGGHHLAMRGHLGGEILLQFPATEQGGEAT